MTKFATIDKPSNTWVGDHPGDVVDELTGNDILHVLSYNDSSMLLLVGNVSTHPLFREGLHENL